MRWAAIVLILAALASAQDNAAGWWRGELGKEAGGLRLALHLWQADGVWKATLDSPDQGAAGVPLSDVSVVDGAVKCTLAAVKTSFAGKMAADGKTLVGTLTADGTPLPLTLARADGPFASTRPQEPKPPYPYALREVVIEQPDVPGVSLAGTLTQPNGAGPWPAVVLVAGSGPNDRDEAVFGHKPFAVLADHLTRAGVAVLRYDKRGVGGSKGDYAQAVTKDFAADARACWRWLRGQPGIDAAHVGLLGHSEGGLVVPLVAGAEPDAAFAVLIGAPAVTGAEILTHQALLMARAMGADEKALAAMEPAHRALVQRVMAGATRDELRPLVNALMVAQGQPADDKAADNVAEGLLAPWMRAFLSYDPVPALRGLRLPVLAMTGELDLQVDTRQNFPPMVAAFEAGGVRDYTVVRVAGANHLLQPAKTGAVDEYSRIELTMLPSALTQISNWILSRMGR